MSETYKDIGAPEIQSMKFKYEEKKCPLHKEGYYANAVGCSCTFSIYTDLAQLDSTLRSLTENK